MASESSKLTSIVIYIKVVSDSTSSGYAMLGLCFSPILLVFGNAIKDSECTCVTLIDKMSQICSNLQQNTRVCGNGSTS